MFNELLNITSETISRKARHFNYITDIKLPPCSFVASLPAANRCTYVLNKEECHEDEYIFSYINFVYCTLDSGNIFEKGLALIILLAGIFFLFLLLGTTSSILFCPALKVISDILSLNENVAGVTLLAFGNCAPDVITGLTSSQSSNRVIYTDFMGAIIFVVFFVGGLIITVCPCVVVGSLFLRDLLFLCFALNYVHCAFSTQYSVTAAEALGILSIYILYIVVVITDQILSNRSIKKQAPRTTVQFDLERVEPEHYIDDEDDENDDDGIIEEDENAISNDPINTNKRIEVFKDIMEQFYHSINPIPSWEWHSSTKFEKALMILKAPIIFVLRLTIPLVDYDIELHGWSRLLISLQIIAIPSLILGLGAPEFTVFGIYGYIMVLVITVPISVVLFIFTDHRKIPFFYKYFAILSAMGSMYVLYVSAQEVVSILTVMGIITRRSSSFLGCTLLAWGNSLGDMVVNLTLARQGYEHMSLSACFGGPLFNALIGIGLSTTILAFSSSSYRTDIYKFGDGLMGLNLNVQLVLGLLILALAASLTNFVLRRSIGIMMILFYVIFFIMAISIEMEFIHPFGCSHRLGEEMNDIYGY